MAYSGLKRYPAPRIVENQLRIARIALDLLAQMPHVHVDRARFPVIGAPAQALEELAPREDDAGALREHDEHLELDERQLRRLAANIDGSARHVDAKLAALDELLAFARQVRRRGSAQQRSHPASELPDRERLRDVVVRAELESENLVELLPARREHDDRHVALSAQSLADLEAVETRKHDVEHDEIHGLLAEPAERLFAVTRLDDVVAVPLERVREQGLDRFLVVDEENCRSGGHRSVRAGSRSPARLL